MNDKQARRCARKQKIADRRALRASRRVKLTWEPGLPRTASEIEAMLEALLPSLTASTPADIEARTEHLPDGSRRIKLTPEAMQAFRLQLQLFRCVFDRDPRPHDPVFWDRSREREGVFPLDPPPAKGGQ